MRPCCRRTSKPHLQRRWSSLHSCAMIERTSRMVMHKLDILAAPISAIISCTRRTPLSAPCFRAWSAPWPSCTSRPQREPPLPSTRQSLNPVAASAPPTISALSIRSKEPLTWRQTLHFNHCLPAAMPTFPKTSPHTVTAQQTTRLAIIESLYESLASKPSPEVLIGH